MDNEEKVRICLSQGEIESMMITIPKRLNQKMVEISNRYPEGYWDKKGLDLKKLAKAELEAEDQEKK